MIEPGYARRRWINRLMLALSSAAAGMAVVLLALILGYTLLHGISALNLNFITQAAKPPGDLGGGMRNEIFGTLILIALASVIALPIGLMTGIFLSEFGSPKLAARVRFAADILAGVPAARAALREIESA